MTGIELPIGHKVSLFSLESGRPLVDHIGRLLGIVPARHEERDFEDGEHKIRPLESVRGRDVYVVESLYGDGVRSVNDKLVRVMFLIAALRDAGASRITAITPYLCYARKDVRTKSRDPVPTRYVALLFEAVGLDRILVVDVHNPAAYENAFRIPADLITAAPALVDAMAPLVGGQDVAVVSPDAGGVKRAERFRQLLERRLARPVGFAFLEKFRSEGVVRGGAVAGDVKGRVVIIVDDLISSGTTLARAAAACRQAGARVAYAAVTHGVFSADAARVLGGSQLERIVILDTVPPRHHLDTGFLRDHVQVIDSAPLLATAIHRLATDGSVSALAEP